MASSNGYPLEQTGEQVQGALDKIINLGNATTSKAGLMSPEDKTNLNNVANQIDNKVNKVTGKGLSTNDYTNEDKSRVANSYLKPITGIPASDLASGVIPDVSQFITASANNLVNYYLKTETYNKEEVDALVATIKQFSYEVVSSLPTASASTMYKIYLVPSEDPQTQNVKDEYITIQSGSTYSWEQIGSTAIDLSGYVTTTQLNTALAAYTTTANLTTLLATKQDVIADLATIRSGASAGATAYQKPVSGIPASDIASGVIPDVSGKQDTLVSGTNIKTVNQTSLLGSGDITIENGEDGVGFDTIETPSTPDGTATITLTNGDTITLDLNHNHPQYYSKVAETSNPSGGFLPDVVYSLGTLTGAVTFALAAAVTGNVNHYFWMFDTGSTAPTITWPTGITWADGSAPTVSASKHYEVSILGGIAYYSEV